MEIEPAGAIQLVITIVSSVLASSGFWSILQKRAEKKDVRTQVLVGLGHDRIIRLGKQYIERGWITVDEYENLHDYLYLPYKAMGGNGSAERIMTEVNRLRIVDKPPTEEADDDDDN